MSVTLEEMQDGLEADKLSLSGRDLFSNTSHILTNDDVVLISSFLKEHPAITSLVIDNYENINDGVVIAISAIPNLTSIQISLCQISTEGIKELARNPNLTSLDLRNNLLSEEAIDALAQNRNLTSLDLSYCDLDAKKLEVLLQNNTLTSLNVDHNSLDQKSMDMVGNMIRRNKAHAILEEQSRNPNSLFASTATRDLMGVIKGYADGVEPAKNKEEDGEPKPFSPS